MCVQFTSCIYGVRLETIRTVVPQSLILAPLFFLKYINGQTNNINSNVCLLMIPLYFQIANILNSVLRKIHKWTEKWKMAFNPDPTKQTQEVNVSRK